MIFLLSLGIAAAAAGWWLALAMLQAFATASWLWGLVALWLAITALRLAWWTLNLGMQVVLRLTTKQLAMRAFRDGVADRLFFSQTLIREKMR